MIPTVSAEDLLRLRVRALRIAGGDPAAERGAGAAGDAPGGSGREPGAERIGAVASRMLAVQGQDWRSARWALGLRAPGTRVADVHAAFDSARIVRSWPMRGTIHVLAAEDIGWLQGATNHRVLAGAPKRRAALGITDATLERLVEVSLAAIRAASGGAERGLDRDGLSTAWTEAGIEWRSNWRYHVIWWLCQNGLAVFGPVREGGEPLLVEAETWIGAPRRLAGDPALAELAARYAVARGPVRVRDLAWWSGLTTTEARRAIALASEAGRLAPVALAGATGRAAELWADPELLGDDLGAPGAVRGAAPGDRWRLLPAFDEHLLGYQDREAQLDPEHFDRIVPGRNGMFLATVVDRGRVVGTWRRGSRAAAGIEATPLPGAQLDLAALAPEAERWSRFHGMDPAPIGAAAA